nr:DUF1345 domain-containing protein [Amycolatopsis rubida]
MADFTYFAFTIGTSFAVPDVETRTTSVRSLVLRTQRPVVHVQHGHARHRSQLRHRRTLTLLSYSRPRAAGAASCPRKGPSPPPYHESPSFSFFPARCRRTTGAQGKEGLPDDGLTRQPRPRPAL